MRSDHRMQGWFGCQDEKARGNFSALRVALTGLPRLRMLSLSLIILISFFSFRFLSGRNVIPSDGLILHFTALLSV